MNRRHFLIAIPSVALVTPKHRSGASSAKVSAATATGVAEYDSATYGNCSYAS